MDRAHTVPRAGGCAKLTFIRSVVWVEHRQIDLGAAKTEHVMLMDDKLQNHEARIAVIERESGLRAARTVAAIDPPTQFRLGLWCCVIAESRSDSFEDDGTEPPLTPPALLP